MLLGLLTCTLYSTAFKLKYNTSIVIRENSVIRRVVKSRQIALIDVLNS